MPRPMKIYPAGPIQGADLMETLRNLNVGLEISANLASLGFAVFPVFADFMFLMRTSKHLEIAGPGGVYEMSLVWMLSADAVFMLPRWQLSKGASKEREVALENDILVFHDLGELINARASAPSVYTGGIQNVPRST